MKFAMIVMAMLFSFSVVAGEIPTPTGETFNNPTLQGFPFLAVEGVEYYQAAISGTKPNILFRADLFCKMLNYKRVYRADVEVLSAYSATVNAMDGVYANVRETIGYGGLNSSVYSLITCIY